MSDEQPLHEDIFSEFIRGTIGWREAVYRIVTQIPPACVLSYGDVAALLGKPRAARQVGYALAALDPDRAAFVPWWRVLRTDGSIAFQGAVGRGDLQVRLLTDEGVVVQNGRVDMATVRWRPALVPPAPPR